LQIKAKIVRFHTADSKPVKQEVNGTVILPPLVFPGFDQAMQWRGTRSNQQPAPFYVAEFSWINGVHTSVDGYWKNEKYF